MTLSDGISFLSSIFLSEAKQEIIKLYYGIELVSIYFKISYWRKNSFTSISKIVKGI